MSDRRRAGKRVAIVQSCYVPWKGYFDLINLVDEFILLDDVQFTKRDWRNRNRIKMPSGTSWLTVPVETKGKYHQRIDETLIQDDGWAQRHWRSLEHTYATAFCFREYRDPIEALYGAATDPKLSQVNRTFLEGICELLGIATPITWSTDYESRGAKSERLVSLCVAAGAREYLSGPRARAYLDEALFREAGVDVVYMDYAGYPEYPQPHPPFDHAVTVLDLLFCVGAEAPAYMKSFTRSEAGV